MSFLFPHFLFAMTLLALPILLHLWSIRRAKRQYFSNTALLKKVSIITNKSSRLKYLLLLSARLLFLFFLTLAFAKIYKSSLIPFETISKTNQYRIDGSCSVLSSQDNISKLSSLLRRINQEEKSIFLDCKSAALHLSDFLQERSRNLVIISDFQKKFVDMNAIDDAHHNLTFVRMDNHMERPNIFVDSIWLEERYFRSNEKNIVWTSIQNAGDSDARDVLVELKIDGRTVASQIASIGKGSNRRLYFQILGNYVKPIHCSVQVNDGSWDFDNFFSFVLSPAQNMNIAIITDQQKNNPIKIAYDQEPLFQCKINKSNVNLDEIERSDLLVFQKDGEPTRNELLQVLGEAKKGKTLIVLPSPNWTNATFELLNNQLGFTAFVKLNSVNDSTRELDKLDVQNPFLSKIFNQVPILSQLPSIKPVCLLKRVDEAILKTKDGNISLGLYGIGNGRMFAFSFGLTGGETFSRDAIFLPIFYRIAESSIVNSLPYYLRQGDKQLVLKLGKEELDNVYSLGNSETRIVTEQRVIGNTAILNLPDNMGTGFWHVYDKHNKLHASFGFNHEKSESNMQFYTTEELVNKYKQNKNVKVIEFDELNKLLLGKEKGDVSKIWRYVVVISFLFLLFEILVARFYSRNNAAFA